MDGEIGNMNKLPLPATGLNSGKPEAPKKKSVPKKQPTADENDGG
jgi:hypothetical protein